MKDPATGEEESRVEEELDTRGNDDKDTNKENLND